MIKIKHKVGDLVYYKPPTDEDIEYVHNNWETLLENNIAIVQYENGFWKVDLRYVKSG